MNDRPFRTLALAFVAICFWAPRPVAAQQIADVRYDVVFTIETASRREIHVEMSFDVTDDDSVSLSLPAWTPGSYELDDYAKNVRGLWATLDGNEIRWDKADYDTWRVYPTGPGEVTVGFDYLADNLDTGSAWARDDFTYFNGTNVFLFPEGGDLSFEPIVTFHIEPDWRVTTELTALSPTEYTARDYHTLVDNPTFVGRFDLDSLRFGDRWYRLATYPRGVMAGANRATLWDQIQRMMPPLADVVDDVPWNRYTTFQVFDPGFGGGSALEHSSSHLGIYSTGFLGSSLLASITAHEIFHAWNVKRLRPADMWPYDYGRPMPTDLLWVSEGITDYYSDLALVRGQIVSPEYFYGTTRDKIEHVSGVPPVALEDASLSAWIGPRDGTNGIYYDKGSLAGLMLDILIRDASDNRRSLDDVLKTLYETDYLAGLGFTEDDWWATVRDASGGRSFEDFHDAYVDGREPYPWDEILPLAGLRLQTEVERIARMGVTTTEEPGGVVVVGVQPGGAAQAAGVQEGDRLVSVGDIAVENVGFGELFRTTYANGRSGDRYDIVVEREGERITLPAELRFAEVSSSRIVEDGTAPEKALRIRNGLLTGSVEG
ncbi:MAG: PDZ domain-containing protein [Gemmatimonadota bacterium]